MSPAPSQVKNEGVPALYSGLSAALARQASYTTLRLGLYDLMKRFVIDGETLKNVRTDMSGIYESPPENK